MGAADTAIAAGQADHAREWAQAALSRAKATGDVRLDAQALASLANFDRLSSRNRRATEASARAALLFKSVGDLADEAIAHTSHANSAIVLARNEEAVEAALLSVELACLGRRIGVAQAQDADNEVTLLRQAHRSKRAATGADPG